jgi:hypothetical protein
MLRTRIGFNEVTDPAFYLNADPDLAFYLNADPDPDPESPTNADPNPDPGHTLVTKSWILT